MSALSEKAASQSSLMETVEKAEDEDDKQKPVEDEPTVSTGDGNEENAKSRQQTEGTPVDWEDQDMGPMIKFKVAYGRQAFDIEAPAGQKVAQFQETIFGLTKVTPALQKLVCKGTKLTPDKTLSECKVTQNSKILLIGSTMEQVVSASTKPSASDIKKSEAASNPKESLSKQKAHSKTVEQGVPDDAMVGIKNVKEPLPPAPLKGMRNKHGKAVRLTFKLENDQLWIGTPDRTDKIPMSNISDIVSEPIEGKEEYSIIGIGVGATELSRIWIYWVPSQYVDAIKKAVMD